MQTKMAMRQSGDIAAANPRGSFSGFLSDMSIRPLTETEFELFQGLIYKEAGIYLSDAKKALLVGRLARRLRALGLNSFLEYYSRIVEDDDRQERVHLLDSICTNQTQFFREPHQFEFLRQRVLPELSANADAGQRERRLRVWSAACSTGEEPYSLAMLLRDDFVSPPEWQIEILATDLSTRALRAAEEGVWPLEKQSEIPRQYLRSSMLRGIRSQEGRMKAASEIRSMIHFARLNLNEESYPVIGTFDLIFCRNVLIYFNAESKTRVVHRLLRHLSPTGYLFLGHAESLSGFDGLVRSVGPTVYSPC